LTQIAFPRTSSKPPFHKGGKKGGKKRAHAEDDELDPMDPSSYSDAPRGGWYVYCMCYTHTYI